eukprot:TRINITY_DN9518_c0_g1_i1.p1 TRINITY_DN9518_c0_g1~~TRINITY_DN9518_c0_g1_i1.p1  ORF type:complete len:347 (-),score=95.05 TRINITY_DN9518_c0_g1_i1:84-1100(-)
MGAAGTKGDTPEEKFLNTKISTIMTVEKKDVVSLSPDDTCEDALRLFQEHNILSAPIIDDNGVCQGFFAMDDVIISLDRVSKKAINVDGNTESPHIRSDQAKELEHRARIFLNHKVKEAIDANRSSGNMFLGIRGDQTVQDALLLFATGVQRIAVFNSRKEIISILSQSTLLRYLAEDTKRLGSLENEPASSLGIPWKRLVRLTDRALVLDAVETMHERSVYSLPIVNSEEKLIAHISMSDFKRLYLTRESLGRLLEPILKFVQENREANQKPLNHIVAVAPTATVKDVVLTLVAHHVHQLYLVDTTQPHPTSLISMTNVCHKIFSNTRKEVLPGSPK